MLRPRRASLTCLLSAPLLLAGCTEDNPNSDGDSGGESSNSESVGESQGESDGADENSETNAESGCAADELLCGSTCVDPQTDEMHCGECNNPCDDGTICNEGACINPCGSGQQLCGEECVDLETDPLHCGACGRECGEAWGCAASECYDLRVWQDRLQVSGMSTLDSEVFATHLRSDAHALVTYREVDMIGVSRIYLAEYWPDATDWTPPIELGTGVGDVPRGPAASMDAAEDMHIAWGDHNGGTDMREIAARFGDGMTGMFGDEVVVADADQVHSLQMGSTADGDTRLMWIADTDGSRTLETAVWEFANQQWASSSTLHMASGAGIDATSLVMRTAGDWSEAIWFEADGLSHGPVSTYLSSGAGAWSTPGNVADFNEDLKGDLDLHLDATGTAVATWRQDIGAATTLFASGHGPREAWSTPVGITLEGLGDVTEAHTAMTPEGDVVAVWSQSAGTMNDVIGFAKFTRADNQWSDPISVHTQMGGQLSSPGVHVDDAGNIIVMWFQAAEIPSDGTDLWTRQYHAATDTWGSESLAFESVNPPSRITFQEVDGKLLAVWDENGSSGTGIFAAWKLLE